MCLQHGRISSLVVINPVIVQTRLPLNSRQGTVCLAITESNDMCFYQSQRSQLLEERTQAFSKAKVSDFFAFFPEKHSKENMFTLPGHIVPVVTICYYCVEGKTHGSTKCTRLCDNKIMTKPDGR